MFQKQLIMRRVLISLAPIFLFSIYLYGWRVPVVTAVVFLFGILTEFLMERTRKKKVSEAVLVTCALYALALPPAVPIWVAIVGIVFAVFLGKEVFGGFGRNVFNPAITGRLFVYITFPRLLQTTWMVPGNFGTGGINGVDGVTAATPLEILRGTAEGSVDWMDLLFGIRAGSIGESSIVLIVIAAIYLIITKTANWRLIVSTFGTALAMAAIFYATGAIDIPPHLYIMSGSIMYVAVFMSTDPVSAPNKPISQWVYGAIIGGVSMLVRTFSGFPEGTSFGILMGNVFASLLDEMFPAKKKKKAPAKPATASATSAAKKAEEPAEVGAGNATASSTAGKAPAPLGSGKAFDASPENGDAGTPAAKESAPDSDTQSAPESGKPERTQAAEEARRKNVSSEDDES